MKFDVGQRVLTPKGEALVTGQSRTFGAVRTSVGQFPEALVTPWVDTAALRADPELMEAWLDEDIDPGPPNQIIETIDARCRCNCGSQGHCHRIMHKADQRIVFRSGHMTITTACRCARTECSCLS